jgi:hypothetical protein
VWNLVMQHRVAQWINQTLYVPVARHFPNVQMSNYDQGHWDTTPQYWPCNLYGYITPPIGNGAHVGTHSSYAYYGGDRGDGTSKFSISTPTVTVTRTATPYGRLLMATRTIRSQVRGGGGVPVMPWIDPKNASAVWPSGHSIMEHSEHYQEMLLHMCLAGVTRFLWFRVSEDMPLTRGIELADCVMVEADAMVGVPGREPLSLGDVVGLLDDFVLSGVRLPNGTRIYRFTASDDTLLPKFEVVASNPATFSVAGHVVTPVEGGRLLAAPGGSCAPGGYWITA